MMASDKRKNQFEKEMDWIYREISKKGKKDISGHDTLPIFHSDAI